MTPLPSSEGRASGIRTPSNGSWSTWSPPADAKAAPTEALVPREGVFEGQIALVGQTLIEGIVRGSLRGFGELVLGPNAQVEGPIECDVVVSRGRILGPVVARRCIRLSDGARMDGDLESPAIEIGDDVIWNGRARVGC